MENQIVFSKVLRNFITCLLVRGTRLVTYAWFRVTVLRKVKQYLGLLLSPSFCNRVRCDLFVFPSFPSTDRMDSDGSSVHCPGPKLEF